MRGLRWPGPREQHDPEVQVSEVAWHAARLCWLLVFSFAFFPGHRCRDVVFYLLGTRANNVIKRV
jgi:hypothetical protein